MGIEDDCSNSLQDYMVKCENVFGRSSEGALMIASEIINGLKVLEDGRES